MLNIPLKWGALMGGAIVAVTLAVYLGSDGKLESTTLSLTTMLLFVFAMTKASLETRTAMGGFISWWEAVKPAWITAVIIVIITGFFTYILYNFIDPELNERMKEVAMETAEKMAGMFGEEAGEKMMEEMENQNFAFDFSKLLISILINGGVIGFIGAAIIAAVVKRKGDGLEDDDLSVI